MYAQSRTTTTGKENDDEPKTLPKNNPASVTQHSTDRNVFWTLFDTCDPLASLRRFPPSHLGSVWVYTGSAQIWIDIAQTTANQSDNVRCLTVLFHSTSTYTECTRHLRLRWGGSYHSFIQIVWMLGCLKQNFCPSHPNCTPLLAYQLSWEIRFR